MKTGGYFVISLDFELMWGMFDKVTQDSYGENLRGTRAAIPEILALFEKYEVHATWATVGMLMCESATELQAIMPPLEQRPQYNNQELSSYEHWEKQKSRGENFGQYYFAPDLVKKIVNTPHQELASHTFSHYYCLESGKNGEAIFAADAKAIQTAADKFNTTLTSIVFPRNQTSNQALKVCQQVGLKTFRGNENHWLYQARKETEQTNLLIRGLRLIDHYLNLSGHHTYPLPDNSGEIINLPASRFFRPYSKLLKTFESFRIKRIKKAMTHAAQRNEVFHLWWHPHNFGINRKENLLNLKDILDHYQNLQNQYGMQSQNMQELTKLVNEKN